MLQRATRILGSWTTNRASYQCKCLSQQLWPVVEPILLLPQLRLWGATIRCCKMIKTHHTLDGHILCISALFEGVLHALFLMEKFSQNLSTNSAGWQKLLFNLLACSEAIMRKPGHEGLQDRTKSSKVSSVCVRWQKRSLSFSLPLSLSHIYTSHHSDNKLWHKLEYQ